ncbi:MAG TPA: hypothetical protein VGU23_01730 [Acidobacteriaceae bacterium]|nr:hypothetical protein [Acidobacteriaceae bacterium]
MKVNPNSILLYGRDEQLLATRRWVLESRGYRVLTLLDLAGFAAIPQNPPIRLVLLCHSLSQDECEAAMVLAEARWPGIQSLTLDAEAGRSPSGLLGQLLHTMDGPAKLVETVAKLMGSSPRAQAVSRS